MTVAVFLTAQGVDWQAMSSLDDLKDSLPRNRAVSATKAKQADVVIAVMHIGGGTHLPVAAWRLIDAYSAEDRASNRSASNLVLGQSIVTNPQWFIPTLRNGCAVAELHATQFVDGVEEVTPVP